MYENLKFNYLGKTVYVSVEKIIHHNHPITRKRLDIIKSINKEGMIVFFTEDLLVKN